jgi:uridine kinase
VVTGSPSEVAASVVDLARSRSATLGAGRLVCIDGPAGSGKTTLGRAVADLTGATVVHTDALMDGWRGLDAVPRQLVGLCEALADGRTGRYDVYSWLRGRYTRTAEVAPGDWLVVEGVASGCCAIEPWTTTLVWVEADPEVRLTRVLSRDGIDVEPHIEQFQVDEQALFARERTRERAEIRVTT